jgi:DNA (cytosine-5)-methyltransferase 1
MQVRVERGAEREEDEGRQESARASVAAIDWKTTPSDDPDSAEWLTPGSAVDRNWRTLRTGEKSQRYFNVQRLDIDRPSPAIMARGGSGPTSTTSAIFSHEPRRFSIPELKVVCGFPPDFVLVGSYAERWTRLGNAVPPLMMHAIAAALRDGVFTRLGRTAPGFIDAMGETNEMEKPPFRIPTMAEVARARGSTGLTVASTFSGCGGSCLGFEMAGYRVLWANEFLPIARESYAANHPETVLDGRDIRKVDARDILEATGLAQGELDVFNGSPPCQAFSSAGQREKGWGKKRDYGNGVKQQNEELFFDYVRLVEGLQPRVFVAENVAGLVRGTAIGFFKLIMRQLTDAGYRVRCKVLDAQWLGVPQTRTRAIFVGVRKDLGLEPEFPKPRSYRYSLREVLPGLASYQTRQAGGGWHMRDPLVQTRGSDLDAPAQAILRNSGDYRVVDRVDGDTELSSADAQKWRTRKLARSRQWGDPKMIRVDPNEPMPAVLTSSEMFAHSSEPRRFTMEELRIVCGFPADFELKGTYSEQWARLGNAVPPLMMREISATLRDTVFARLGRTAAQFWEAR